MSAHSHINSGIHRCSGTRVTTRLFLDKAAHTWARLQQGNCVFVYVCVYVHVKWGSVLTNIQQRPGGKTESMESKGKRGESLWKIKLGLKYRGVTTATYTEPHTHTNRDN